MGAIPAARLYHTKYREYPPPPTAGFVHPDWGILALIIYNSSIGIVIYAVE